MMNAHRRHAEDAGGSKLRVLLRGRVKLVRALDLAKQLFSHMAKARLFGLAAEMSFWLFLALVPLAAMGGLLIARLWQQGSPLADSIIMSTPYLARQLIAGELGKVAAWNGGAAGPVATVVFVWLASNGIHAIFDAFEVETECTRPWWKKRLVAIACCVALSIGFFIVALLGTGLSWVWRSAGVSVPASALAFERLGTVVRFVIGGLIAFGLIAGLYWAGVAPTARRQMPLVPGALVAVGLGVALGVGYGAYVAIVGSGGAYQGGLAVIGVTLMTLYLFSTAILIGLEINWLIGVKRRVKIAKSRLTQVRGHREIHRAPRAHAPHSAVRLPGPRQSSPELH